MNIFEEVGRDIAKINVNASLTRVLRLNKDFLKSSNIEAWQERGEYPEGGMIEPFYTPFTVSKKVQEGKESDFVTLTDTGSFTKGITAKVGGGQLELDSRDSKSDDLKEKYGDEIFGIDDFAIVKMQEQLIEEIEKQL